MLGPSLITGAHNHINPGLYTLSWVIARFVCQVDMPCKMPSYIYSHMQKDSLHRKFYCTTSKFSESIH